MPSGKEKSTKDREMAAHLVRSGYPHGRRKTSTLAPPEPAMKDVGSAAYRRRQTKGKS